MILVWLFACLPDFPSSTLAEDPTHDYDGDGFVERPGDGTVGDCDDWDPSIHPDAIEVCDGVDNDCDGRIDDGDPDLEASDWWSDNDGDGFGNPDDMVPSACDPGSGTWVTQADDCDDDDPDVYPDAPESCEDDVDSDCDGVRICELTPDAVLLGERGSDRLGAALVLPGDLNGDGYPDLALGAEGYDAESGDSLANAGAVYLVWGPVAAGTHDVAALGLRLVGTQGSFAGLSLAAAGDMDGDGRGDLIVGAPATETNRGVSPRVHLVMAPSGSGELDLTTVPTWIGDHAVGALFGWSVAGVGDIDGDDLDDLVVGAPGDSSQTGEVTVITGAMVADGGDLINSTVLWGTEADDGVGERVAAAGDIDGDGLADFLVGALRESADDRGTAWLVLGREVPTDAAFIDDVGRAFRGQEPGMRVGSGLGYGDLDGDGRDDLLIGASGMDDGKGTATGGYFVVVGGGVAYITGDLAQAQTRFTGDEPAQGLGISAAIGDLDSDGQLDVVLRVRESELVGDADTAVALLGPFSGVIPVGSGQWLLSGVQPEGFTGSSLALGEDLLEEKGMVLVAGASAWTDTEEDQGAVLLARYAEDP